MGGGHALLLETQAMPDITRKVGEPHSGRVCYASVDAYLTRRHATFDRKLLALMFEEADFRREGSLAPRDLIAALTARYPKRRFTQQWRDLAALILGAEAPPVSAAEVAKLQNTAAHGQKRTVPFDMVWATVEELPPPKHSLRAPPPRAPSPPPLEWEAVLARADAVQGADGPAAPAVGGASGSAHAVLARTSRGVKVCGSHGGASAAAVAGINAGALKPAAGGGAPRCTFDAAAAFAAHSGGILLASQLRSEAGQAQARDQRAQDAPRLATGRQSFREWLKGPQQPPTRSASARRAPPSAATLVSPPRQTPSALQRLRDSVRVAGHEPPPFLTHFHPLLPGDEFWYQSLGQPLDLRGPSICRQ